MKAVGRLDVELSSSGVEMVPGSREEPTETSEVALVLVSRVEQTSRTPAHRATVEINSYRTPSILPLEFALGELCRASLARNHLC